MKFSNLTKLLIIAIFVSFACENIASASIFRKKKKPVKTEYKKPVKTDSYTKFIKDIKDSAKSSVLSVYKDKKGSLYLEFPKSMLGRRILAGSTVTTVSDPNYVNVGMKYVAPLCLQVDLVEDSVIVLRQPMIGASSRDSSLYAALEKNYVSKIFSRIPVKAYSKDSSKVIFDISRIIRELAPKSSGFSISKTNSLTYFGKLKAFKDNVSMLKYDNVDFQRSTILGKINLGSGTISSTISIKVLPEEKMRPRVQDSRIGVFSTSGINRNLIVDMNPAEDGFRSYRIANRWRLELSDTTAWLSGKSVTVKNPVVWYIDDSFPKEWQKPIADGVTVWNKVFEKFGLENVMVAKPFPAPGEDKDFDPDNLNYNCIRYVPNATMNAMGPSWVDPETGEILNASVLVYNDVIRLINNWRFVQTSQVDESVRAKKMPSDVISESLSYVIAHEIGHTLGLMHNMAASAAVPVDSLRNAEYTRRHGLSPSIMDYARFNYVAQPGDRNLTLMTSEPGVYDELAIEWLYRPVVEAKDMWSEYEIAGKLLDRHSGDKYYRYGAQQISSLSTGVYDPSALTEDLGDDPVKAGDYGISNLKYILSNLNTWIKDDADYYHRSSLYTQIASQFNRYLNNVLAQVGGIYLYREKGDRLPAVPVSKDVQRASLKWVIKNFREASWLENKDLTLHFGLQLPYTNRIASSLASSLTSDVVDRVVAASVVKGDSGYDLREYFGDLYKEIFLPSSPLSSSVKTLQREMIQDFAKPLLASKSKISFAGEQSEGMPDDELSCYSPDLEGDTSFGMDADTYQRKLNVKSISEEGGNSIIFLRKILSLAKTRRNTAVPSDRAHYEYLYRTISLALGE